MDDQCLGRLLRGMPLEGVPAASEIFTTGYWYVRLCQAVLARSGGGGVLSRPFAGLPDPIRGRALAAIMDLPEHIGLLGLRTLGPRIGQLRWRYALNILSLEALASAVELGAHVVLSCDSPRLADALDQEGRTWMVVARS